MSRTQRERDRLLSSAARLAGMIVAAFAAVTVSLPGALPMGGYLAVMSCLVALAIGHFFVPRTGSALIILATFCVCLLAIVLIGLSAPPNIATTSVISLLAGGSAAGSGLALGIKTEKPALVIVFAVLTVTCVTLMLAHEGAEMVWPLALVVLGWIFGAILAIWISRTVPYTLHRISNMTHAYHAERQASEAEAQRRQGARLLHDTVLATLTLLAHSGVGVSANALREQAGEDAALLRQLRLGFSPSPAASGDYKLQVVSETALGNTLESVKQRFRRMGLEVNWHGSGQVLLPGDVLDAFLLALSECLENVRRHAGVDEAHVTITDDESTVRAMVTDSGVGFDVDAVAPGRLGFAESVVARLHDVGGNARLFSSPGSGTTVVLEVPK
jgi:signal transduction histidine kinase